MYRRILAQFEENVGGLKNLEVAYAHFEQQPLALGMTDILRAEYVMLVAALDFYMHEVVRAGILTSFSSSQDEVFKALAKIEVPLNQVFSLLQVENGQQEYLRKLDGILQKKLEQYSFQSPSSVEIALSYLNKKKIWKEISVYMNTEPKAIREELALIVHRRNYIAHQADYNPSTGEKKPITLDDVKEVREFLTNFVRAVHKILSTSS